MSIINGTLIYMDCTVLDQGRLHGCGQGMASGKNAHRDSAKYGGLRKGGLSGRLFFFPLVTIPMTVYGKRRARCKVNTLPRLPRRAAVYHWRLR